MRKHKGYITIIALFLILLVVCLKSDGFKKQIAESTQKQETNIENGTVTIEEIQGKTLGIVTILPPLIAVVIAFVTREVLTSLISGLLSGFFLLSVLDSTGPMKLFRSLCYTFIAACESIIRVVGDFDNAAIILLCFAVGGLVAVINKTGGFKALAEKLIRRIKTAKGAGYIGELLGCLIFFDDYANSLIIGPLMQPLTDRLKVSREKLAFIVDSTAAPVAGMAVISSWVAAEVGIIDEGLKVINQDASAYNLFLGSIPFCFYNIFCLIMMFVITSTGREFGPMLKAERRARNGKPHNKNIDEVENNIMDMEAFQAKEGVKTSFLTALVPIVLMIALSFVGFYINGLNHSIETGELAAGAAFSFTTLRIAVGNADTALVMFIATIAASGIAIIMGKKIRCFTLREGVDVFLEGVKSLMLTVVILILAWAMSDAVKSLGTCYYLVEVLKAGVPYWLIPTLVFITCCAVSFAVGSYGTMFIVMPIVIPIAYSFYGSASFISNQDTYISMCIASVLAGSIFGDHCSPITDTTILSSIGSGCNNMDHVKTQIPYAVMSAIVAVVCGTIPAAFGVSPIISILCGIAACFVIMRVIGKKV
ncbi:MAG: Na+/H+ antiporter NhaC family protein [Hespellia sp.]|nr:Na+/H+ antiporter NhaC family protein [Hespellia sp.]